MQAFTPFNDDGSPGQPVELDADRALEVVTAIATEAECDPDAPGTPASGDVN